MRYIQLLSVVLALAVLLTGCGGGGNNTSSAPESAPMVTTTTTVAPTTVATTTTTTTPPTKAPTTTAAPTTVPPTTVPTTAPVPIDHERLNALKGAVNGNVYSNKHFGFAYTLETDMRFFNSQEIEGQIGQSLDLSNNQAVNDYMEKEGGFVAMYAVSADMQNAVYVTLEKVTPEIVNYTEQGYSSVLIDVLKQSYRSIGLSTRGSGSKGVKFAGESCWATYVNFSATSSDDNILTHLAVIRKSDGYFATINFIGPYNSGLESKAAAVSRYKG